MPDYALAPEHEELRKTVEQFAHDVVAPVIGDYYERDEFPYPIVEQMGELGLFGLPFPEEYGGMGGDYFALCVAIEELARVDSSVAITLEAGVSLGAMPVYRFGTEEQKRRYLPDLTAGRALAAFGLTESVRDPTPASIATTARLDGDEWVINGSKVFITNSGTDITGFVTVTAVTAEADGRRDQRHHRPQRHARASPCAPKYSKVGWNASDTHELSFDDVRVPGGEPAGGARPRLCAVPADPGRGSDRHRRAGHRAEPRGASTRVVRYASERIAFGRPIGAHQAIAFKIADMEARTHLSRLAWYDAAARLIAGEPFKLQAAIAKLHSTEAAVTNAREATQIFGGYGFMNEYPVARFWRDSKVLEVGEGTSRGPADAHRPPPRGWRLGRIEDRRLPAWAVWEALGVWPGQAAAGARAAVPGLRGCAR